MQNTEIIHPLADIQYIFKYFVQCETKHDCSHLYQLHKEVVDEINSAERKLKIYISCPVAWVNNLEI